MTNIFSQRLLKCLLAYLTINGLSPFTFDFGNGVNLSVKTSKKLLIYSIFASVVVNISVICAMAYATCYHYRIYFNDATVFWMISFEYCFSLTKGIVLFALHNIQHIRIATLINQAMKMHQIGNRFTQSATVLNKRVTKIAEIKVISIVIQITVSLLIMYSETLLDWAIISYPHTLTMLASAIYIFGLMLLSLNFIISINEKLVIIEKNNRFNSEKSAYILWGENDIDEVSLLLDKMYEFTITHNGLYGVHLTLTLIGSMALILCSLFYSINSLIELTRGTRSVDKTINEFIYAVSNTVFHGIEISGIVLIADAISKEFQEMQCLLFKCSKLDSSPVRKSIERISFQMSQMNLKISMCGMSPIQKPMMMAICSTLVCYLTISVQFKLNQK